MGSETNSQPKFPEGVNGDVGRSSASTSRASTRVDTDHTTSDGRLKSVLTNRAAPSKESIGEPQIVAGSSRKKNGLSAQRHVRFSAGVIERELKKECLDDRSVDCNNKLWRFLGQFKAQRPSEYFRDTVVAANDSGIPCLQKGNVAINVRGREHRIHANRIELLRQKSLFGRENHQYYVAAQAPQNYSGFEAMLIQAVESGAGLFQFVLPSEHDDLFRKISNTETAETSVSSILQRLKIESGGLDRCIKFGGGYEVVGMRTKQSSQHCTCQLKVKKGGEYKTVYLTQVAFKFDHAVLESNSVEAANNILDYHIALSKEKGRSPQAAPMMVSHAGVGRNATLIVYHEISQMLDQKEVRDEEHLDSLLQKAIIKGRDVRGPLFVDSEQQLLALRSSLLKKLHRQNR